MELTLAESVLLLVLDDAKGSTGFTPIDPGLAGALLVDLGQLGALRPEGTELHPVEGVGIEHPVLAQTYTAIARSSNPRSAKAWVGRLPSELKPLTGTVADSLVARGILTEQRVKVLGLFRSTRFPEADPGPEQVLRYRLRDVLSRDGQTRRRQHHDGPAAHQPDRKLWRLNTGVGCVVACGGGREWWVVGTRRGFRGW